MQFQREPASHELFQEMMPLLQKHWEEIAHFKDIPLEPDWDMYLKIDQSGALRNFTARDDQGKLIGYAVFFVRSNINYKSSIQASQDVIFIDPTVRGFGAKFILWCDKQLKDEGIDAVYHHVKEAHNFGPMLERLGYKLVDLIFTKRLN